MNLSVNKIESLGETKLIFSLTGPTDRDLTNIEKIIIFFINFILSCLFSLTHFFSLNQFILSMTTTPSIHTLPSLFRHHEPFPLKVHFGSTSSSHLQDLFVLFIRKSLTKGNSQSEIGQISVLQF